ncbi:hypothetical protein MLD38_014583 [Melastoma candidum]|uniref:Uncharacterized protein n=1 Tax=Melastoma candidum TaxID=119954 RepID=A0ACB9RDE4_9MYRT|nr:hypothetical protein MLD38_014583 [Melastoma candidum]
MAFHSHGHNQQQQQQQLGHQDLTTTLHHFPSVHSSPPNWLSPAPAPNTTKFLHLSNSPDSSSAANPQPQPPPHWPPGLLPVDSSSSLDLKDSLPQADPCANPAATSKPDGGDWQSARNKADILAHPLYEQLLSAHVACLRIATPVDQLPRIDAQLAQSQNVVNKYSAIGGGPALVPDDSKELDHFMTHYVLLLCSFKEQLQQHVRVHAMEAVMACWEIEQSLQSLTGASPGEGTGLTMSDDEDEQAESDANLFDDRLDGMDALGFGPLTPTESERSLLERIRLELKHELKQGYKEKIIDIREEILRKRRAGKLPGDTTSVLKAWWQSHSKWPYPTEEDKIRLVQETGLQLKQINNWFINQRKRNWHSNPSTSTVTKSKSKR